MRVYRLCQRKFAEPLNGIGASLYGGRWNNIGTELIYTASSRALAMAEVVVHVTIATLPPNYVMVEIELPETMFSETLDPKTLPAQWQEFPIFPSSKSFGDEFVRKNKFAIFKVPSAVVQGDFNYLLNPRHAQFSKIKIIEIVDFPFDKRILKP